MRARPVRSRIFLPVVRLGIVSDDWKWVFAIAFLGFFLPFLFWKYISPARFLRVPIHFWVGLVATMASYSFFYWIRMGRRPLWFQHSLQTLIESSVRRRTLPVDRTSRPRFWLKER
ncbi:MAG: hypothetical protein MOB07_13990 [Acidobacteria bacterium]|nr:hypothetical protein [Acidobacteriota bacterium]